MSRFRADGRVQIPSAATLAGRGVAGTFDPTEGACRAGIGKVGGLAPA